MDGSSPAELSDEGTPSVRGITYREIHLVMEICIGSDMITSTEIVAVNLMLDDTSKKNLSLSN